MQLPNNATPGSQVACPSCQAVNTVPAPVAVAVTQTNALVTNAGPEWLTQEECVCVYLVNESADDWTMISRHVGKSEVSFSVLGCGEGEGGVFISLVP